MGLIGLGARHAWGSRQEHEVGFLAFPLSMEGHFYPLEDSPDCRDDFGGCSDLGVGFLDTRLYYRYNWHHAHMETGVLAPLVFFGDRLYDHVPPVLAYFGFGF